MLKITLNSNANLSWVKSVNHVNNQQHGEHFDVQLPITSLRAVISQQTLKLGTESWSKEAALSSLVGVSKSKGRCRDDFEVLLFVGCLSDQLETWQRRSGVF